MATSITKEGIHLVKQEVTEVVLDETENILTNEEESVTRTSLVTSEEKGSKIKSSTLVSRNINLHENDKSDNTNASQENIGNRDEIDDYDDDEDEGNLLIDDNDEVVTENNTTSSGKNVVGKDYDNFRMNQTKNDETGRGHIKIVPNSEKHCEVEDDEDDEDSSEKGDKEVTLEKLPRPVNELNCRQSRTYLVKLLRAANGGLNPHYGNPDMKPAFWPDYYWPWAKLTDVHTKPRGMNEPLQYSEMMKLAIARGYQYFGYDPDTYFDPLVEKTSQPSQVTVNQSNNEMANESNQNNLQTVASDNKSIKMQEVNDGKTMKYNTISGKPDILISNNEVSVPPKLPRALSLVNCIQARTVLARLLRYQQGGNNPMYGSPETEPPWWPNNLIRWIDMVDLRGKPPYLPDGYTYTEVLKEAIGKCLRYNNLDPETHVDPELLNQPGMQRRHASTSISNPSVSNTVVTKSVSLLSSPKLSTTGLNLQTASLSVTQAIPTLSTLSTPLNIPQMTRFVPIAPAPSGVPLAQLGTTTTLTSPQMASSPIQIQIQPSLTNQSPQTSTALLQGTSVLAQPQRITLNTEPIIAQTVGQDGKQMVVGRREQIMLLQPSPIGAAGSLAGIPTSAGINDIVEIQPEEDEEDDDDEDAENLPPRLPLPIGRLNCSTTRTVLAKLIRFHCGNQLPNYGNPASMPCWWPNHLIDWTQIKNLSHKYEGYLGNTYSNCLRIAVIRGYAHYGLDANEYVEKGNNGTTNGNTFNLGKGQGNYTSLMDRKKHQVNPPHSEEEIVIEPAFYGNEDSMDSSSVIQSDEDGVIRMDGTPVTAPVTVQATNGGLQQLSGISPRLPTEPLPPAVANIRQISATVKRSIGPLSSKSRSAISSNLGRKSSCEILSDNIQPSNVTNISPRRKEITASYVNLKGDHMKSIVESNNTTNGNFPTKLLRKKNWFPPRINSQRAICKPSVAKSMKGCKVILEKINTQLSSPESLSYRNISCKEQQFGKESIGVPKFIYDDMRIHQKFTDFYVQGGIGNNPEKIPVHRIMLISHNPKLKSLIEEVPQETDSGLIFAGIENDTLKLIVNAIYLGQVVVVGKESLKKLEAALEMLKPYGILCDLKRKPRTFSSWKISHANLKFTDVSSSTNDPSDDENIDNDDEDDEDFVLEDAHLLDYDSDDDYLNDQDLATNNSKGRVITESYINEVRKQVFSKSTDASQVKVITIVDEDEEMINEYSENINCKSTDNHELSISAQSSTTKESNAKEVQLLDERIHSKEHNDMHETNKSEPSPQSSRPTSARLLAKKIATAASEDNVSQSKSNKTNIVTTTGTGLKIAIEDSSENDSSIPIIDDKIQTRRAGLRNLLPSSPEVNTKRSPSRRKAAEIESSTNISNDDLAEEELGRGKRTLRKRQLSSDSVQSTSPSKLKIKQSGTMSNNKNGNKTVKDANIISQKSPSNLRSQKSPNNSSPHSYNSRSKSFVKENDQCKRVAGKGSQNVDKQEEITNITDSKDRRKTSSLPLETSMERTTRRSLRKEIEQAQNNSIKTCGKPSVPGKCTPKVKTEIPKDASASTESPIKKSNEKWTFASPNSDKLKNSDEASPRGPRKRQAMPDSSNVSPERTAAPNPKRFKLSPSTQPTSIKLKEANKPKFEGVNESLLNEKLQEGQIVFVRFLMKLGFLLDDPPLCNKCNSNPTPMQLVKYTPGESNVASGSSKIQATDGVAWVCPSCNNAASVRPGSIFARCSSSPGVPSSRGVTDSTESLCWIMRLVLCWKDNTSLMSCQQATGADVDKIFLWYNICKEYYGVSGS